MAGFSVEAVFKAVDQMTQPFRQMERGVTRSIGRMQAQFRQVDQVGKKVTSTFHHAGVAMGAAGVAVGAAALNVAKTGAEFEQAITSVGAVSLKSRDQIADLEAKALQLGASTKFTATEVAQGMELMAKAGFQNADILSGVEGMLAAAAASGGELAETAGTVSNVLKGMGLQTSEAGRVADVLALASSRTNSTINSLGESMKNVSPVARQFGISFEDAVASVALLQDVGLDASEAGSATATMLTKLAKPTDAIAKRMREMGVTFQDAKGNMLPLGDVLANLDKASKRAGGNMDVVAFMADLVGLRGQKAALNLKDMFDKGKVAELADQLRNAEGAAAKMAAIKMDSATGDWLRLDAAIDAVKIALFSTENGPLRGILQAMTKWVDANKDLMVSGFKDFMGFMRENGEAIVDTLMRLGRVAAVVYGVATAFKVWNLALELSWALATANPFTLWIVGLTALVALIVAFWPEISGFFGAVWDGIVRAGEAIWPYLVEAWDAVVGAVRSAFDAIWAVVGPFFTAWAELYVGLWALAWEVLKKLGAAVVSVFATLGGWLRSFWAGVVNMLKPVVLAYVQGWQAVIDMLVGGFETFFGYVKAGFLAVVDFLRPAWEPMLGMVQDLAEGIVSAFRWAGEQIAAFFSPVLDRVGGVIDSVRSIGRKVLGSDEDEAGGRSAGIEVPSPQQSIARSISERTERTEAEITVKAERGSSAAVTKRPRAGAVNLQASGAF